MADLIIVDPLVDVQSFAGEGFNQPGSKGHASSPRMKYSTWGLLFTSDST